MIGSRIRQARKALGLSQQSLADMVGVNQSAISGWERGDSDPTTDNMAATAIVLSVEFEWLATGRGEVRPGTLSLNGQEIRNINGAVLPLDQRRLLDLYLKLNAQRRSAVLAFFERWVEG